MKREAKNYSGIGIIPEEANYRHDRKENR